jgi:hypothetical protein
LLALDDSDERDNMTAKRVNTKNVGVVHQTTYVELNSAQHPQKDCPLLRARHSKALTEIGLQGAGG